MEYKLSPSILSADFCNLEEGIRQTEENGAVYLHFDVMDGVFVPSISFGMPVLASIKPAVKQVIDTHLMITEPIRYVEAFAEAGADILTVHYQGYTCDSGQDQSVWHEDRTGNFTGYTGGGLEGIPW
jgi:ribulose-phosphate 3-epimerase